MAQFLRRTVESFYSRNLRTVFDRAVGIFYSGGNVTVEHCLPLCAKRPGEAPALGFIVNLWLRLGFVILKHIRRCTFIELLKPPQVSKKIVLHSDWSARIVLRVLRRGACRCVCRRHFVCVLYHLCRDDGLPSPSCHLQSSGQLLYSRTRGSSTIEM